MGVGEGVVEKEERGLRGGSVGRGRCVWRCVGRYGDGQLEKEAKKGGYEKRYGEEGLGKRKGVEEEDREEWGGVWLERGRKDVAGGEDL
jgi:hypothetical protein